MVSPPAAVAQREHALRELSTRTFDLVIIGGGITGAGVARDAALRGLSVALVEKGDYASGTSSKSTKLVHGGLRYLEQGHVRLVWESVNERARLMRLAPHLVRAQAFLTPSYRGMRPGLFVMDCGLWLYDALSGFRSPRLHRTFRARAVQAMEPGLRREGLRGGIVYYDCATDDARLTLENILDARRAGAVTLNHARALRLIKDGERVTGAEVELAGGDRVEARGKVVVNATGPWCDEVRALLGQDRILRPTKGVHIVVDAARFPLGRALLVRERKRVVFLLPWGARSVIGTTDTFYEGSPDEVDADRADVDYLIEVGNHYFPDARLTAADVISTWAGLRPLLRPPAETSASAVSREHHLESAPGLVTVAGGKLTTYRTMAAEVVDVACEQLAIDRRCATDDRPLPGGLEVHDAAGVERIAGEIERRGLPRDNPQLAQHLARTYGARAAQLAQRIATDGSAGVRLDAELPFVMAEVDEAVEVEQARTIADVLERRVPLILHARDQGLGVAEQVAARMAPHLGWSEAERALEVTRYQAAVARTRRFRAGPAA